MKDGGKVWVSLRRACENLGLAVEVQLRKLKGKAWACMTISVMQVPGDEQRRAFTMIDLETLPMWLTSIDDRKVKAHIRGKLIKYQREAAKVLADHFFGRAEQPPQEADPILVVVEQATKALAVAGELPPLKEPTVPTLVDHPLAAIFPLMPAPDLAALAADIEANGLREPVWLLDGKILDGRNRYRACVLNGLDHRVEHYRGADPLGFVLSKNLHRRHLDTSQRAVVAASIAKWKVGDNQHTAEVGSGIPLPTHEKAAELLNVSVDSVKAATRVKADGVPELVKAVEAGEVSVSAAAEVAKLPPEEQKAAVAEGPKAVKKKAAAARKAKDKPAPAAGPAAGKPEPTAEPPAPESHPADEFASRVAELCRRLDGCKAAAADLAAADTFGRHIHAESVTLQIEAARGRGVRGGVGVQGPRRQAPGVRRRPVGPGGHAGREAPRERPSGVRI